MSRVMLTSCGIQWLAQEARYFSQAHLYLNGTSWLTSVWPLMMRLSEALTRCGLTGAEVETVAAAESAASCSVRVGAWGSAEESGGSAIERLSDRPLGEDFCGDGLTSSSHVNIEVSNIF